MADYYCKCRNCEYVDPTETNGYKWSCTYYKCYEYPDEIKECRHYNERGSGNTECFLTTVCCEEKDFLMTAMNLLQCANIETKF